MEGRTDIPAVRPEVFRFAQTFHDLRLTGAGNLPLEGPALLVGNHCFSPLPVGGTVVSEHCLLTQHLIQQGTGRAPRVIAHLNYYATLSPSARSGIDRLGFVPATLENGIELLRKGQVVLIYPEGRASQPPYRLRRFYWGFARMALSTGAPVIPAVFTGPHESRLRVEKGGRQLYLNAMRPNRVPYHLRLEWGEDVRDMLGSRPDDREVSAYCESLRQRMQRLIVDEVKDRPLYQRALRIQERHGDRAPSPA